MLGDGFLSTQHFSTLLVSRMTPFVFAETVRFCGNLRLSLAMPPKRVKRHSAAISCRQCLGLGVRNENATEWLLTSDRC